MSELGETTDPRELIPGDPGELEKSRGNLARYAEALEYTAKGMKGLDSGGWTGEAADAYRDRFEVEPKRWLEASDSFRAADQAITKYLSTLGWAQNQAGVAIDRYQAGEQASKQAENAPAPPPGAPPPPDPGQADRDEAQAILQNARDQLNQVGDEAASAINAAQQNAPEASTWFDDALGAVGDAGEAVSEIPGNALHYGGTALANAVDFTVSTAGAVAAGGTVIAGAGADVVGADGVADDLYKTARNTGNAMYGAADDAASGIRHAAYKTANFLGAENPPSITEDPEKPPNYILVDRKRYPESARHIREAQSGKIYREGDTPERGEPKPADLTVDRDGAKANRAEALEGTPSRGKDNLDRDEYPPATFEEGGKGASVKYIDKGDNRGSGSSMGHQLKNYDDGDVVHVETG